MAQFKVGPVHAPLPIAHRTLTLSSFLRLRKLRRQRWQRRQQSPLRPHRRKSKVAFELSESSSKPTSFLFTPVIRCASLSFLVIADQASESNAIASSIISLPTRLWGPLSSLPLLGPPKSRHPPCLAVSIVHCIKVVSDSRYPRPLYSTNQCMLSSRSKNQYLSVAVSSSTGRSSTRNPHYVIRHGVYTHSPPGR